MSSIRIFILTLTVILMGFTMTDAQNEESAVIQWISLEEALSRSETEPRKIFIDVYTDWCGWCKVMDRTTFKNKDVVEYVNANYYAIKLNAEGEDLVKFKGYEVTEREFAAQLRVTGFPTIVFADEKIEKVFPVPGYQKAGTFKEMLEKFNSAN